MKVIFIRHGDPNYEIDSLTEKGRREAELLSKRFKNWENITQVYCSPLGRAQLTAKYCLDGTDLTPITYEWLREFNVPAKGEHGEVKRTPWDYMPSFWTKRDKIYDKNNWYNADIFEGSQVKDKFFEVTAGLDSILASYGYVRKGNIYETSGEKDNTTLVFFCHLGVSYVMIGHLLGISPALLWHAFFVAPTAVTILGTEEREKGIAAFRAQVYGDCSHLLMGGEPISSSGYYTDAFQG